MCFSRKNSPSKHEHVGNELGGLRAGRKWWGRCLRARTSKSRWKTPHTLKHMLNFHRFAIDWYIPHVLITAGKGSNRALKSSIFTCVSMGPLFSVVPPSRPICPDLAFWRKTAKTSTAFDQISFILVNINISNFTLLLWCILNSK